MRLLWIALLLVFLVLIGIIIIRKIKTKIFIIVVLAVLLGVFLLGGHVINVSVIDSRLQEGLNAVLSEVGDYYIKSEDGTLKIKVGEEWYPIESIGSYNGNTVQVNGATIQLVDTGIQNTIRVLSELGIIK